MSITGPQNEYDAQIMAEQRAEIATLRARLAVAEQSEKDCRQIIDTYVDETEALQKMLAVAEKDRDAAIDREHDTTERLLAADAALAEARDGEQYSDTRLTEHAEAVGVDPDHIDFIDDTTKAIIQMWADNSKLKATNAEQFRLYCEETKKHNETSTQLTALTAENAALRDVLRDIADNGSAGACVKAQHALHPATKEST